MDGVDSLDNWPMDVPYRVTGNTIIPVRMTSNLSLRNYLNVLLNLFKN